MGIFDKKLVIRIRKHTQAETLMQWLFILPFLFSGLTELLLFPDAIKYICDVIWLCLVILLMLQRGLTRREYGLLCTWVLCFLLYTFLAYMVNFQSPFYFLWGFRNNFRFYAAFLAFGYFLKEEYADRLLKMLDALFWVDVVISLVQYYVFSISGDRLGGLFGAASGCNGYSAVFFSIIVTKALLCYLGHSESVWRYLLKCAAAVYISALAEIKFFFVVFVVITVLAVLFTEFTWRKLFLLLASAIGLVLGTSLLAQLFGGGQKWFTLEWMLDIVGSDRGYTSSGDLNRLTAIPMINELWLKTLGQQLFGMGLGNCDTATYAIVNTPFFEKYGDMHYTWMSHAMMYLETGYMGLVFYFGFFVLVFFGARRIERRSDGNIKTYCRMAKIMAVCCAMIAVYNSSLRTEAGYMAYFILALPFIYKNNEKQRLRQKGSE